MAHDATGSNERGFHQSVVQMRRREETALGVRGPEGDIGDQEGAHGASEAFRHVVRRCSRGRGRGGGRGRGSRGTRGRGDQGLVLTMMLLFRCRENMVEHGRHGETAFMRGGQ